jgi:hypothetical protein
VRGTGRPRRFRGRRRQRRAAGCAQAVERDRDIALGVHLRVAVRAREGAQQHRDVAGDGVEADHARPPGSVHQVLDEVEDADAPGSRGHRLWARHEHLGQRSVLGLDLCRRADEALEGAPRVRVGQRFAGELGEALEALPGQRVDELVLVREVAVDGADSDAGRACDLLHLGIEAVARHAGSRRDEDLLAVAASVRAHLANRRDDGGLFGEFDRCRHHINRNSYSAIVGTGIQVPQRV